VQNNGRKLTFSQKKSKKNYLTSVNHYQKKCFFADFMANTTAIIEDKITTGSNYWLT
jgi:hypothetical protein